jgi:branched-chain amino acid aminotransferase
VSAPLDAVVWVDGRLVDAGAPAVPALDHGLLVGDGVFETISVHHGVPFALDRHLDRLVHSARGLGLEPPDLGLVRQGIGDVLGAGGPRLGRLRVTVTSGPGPLGSARGPDGPCTIVIGAPATAWAPTARVAVAPWPRNERGPLAGLKTTSYAENVVALHQARARGADEAVFGNTRGELCEGTGSNVFVGIGGRLVTPPLAAGCLAGVTRAFVLELTGAAEEAVPLGALGRADEAFLTSTTRGVHPIETVDGTPLPACPGPLTRAAAAAFAGFREASLGLP